MKVERKISQAILKTLCYADIFDYPLTSEEIWRWLITNSKLKTQNSKLQLKIQDLMDEGKLQTVFPFYFLKGRGRIVKLRKKRERWSKKKLEIGRRVTKWLRLIPTIKMVAVTGALAMNNSDEEDDIDLLIVTAKDRLWLTRFLTVLLVELVAKRRHPRDKKVKNKICLNMFLDEDHLKIPPKEQDLFSAHEVCQMKVLGDRDGIYKRFWQENQWVKKFLPNGVDTKIRYDDTKRKRGKPPNILISRYLNILEKIAYRFQLAYMRSRKTTEITDPHRIRFHPQDARIRILKEYKQRLDRWF